ncbi:hypothetical protein GA0115258_120114, partial [Streptomyces sp. LamerLS-31b]
MTGDEVYGGNPKVRSALEKRGLGYVLAVACSAEVTTGAGTFRADGGSQLGSPHRTERSFSPVVSSRNLLFGLR